MVIAIALMASILIASPFVRTTAALWAPVTVVQFLDSSGHTLWTEQPHMFFLKHLDINRRYAKPEGLVAR